VIGSPTAGGARSSAAVSHVHLGPETAGPWTALRDGGASVTIWGMINGKAVTATVG
jgi:hypothetical protein